MIIGTSGASHNWRSFGEELKMVVVTLQLQQSFSRACLNRDHDRAVQNNRNNQSAGNINRLLHETARDVGKPSSEGGVASFS